MKPPYIILSIWVTLILSGMLSVSAAVPTGVPPWSSTPNGGWFQKYFDNMIQTTPCSSGNVITGFNTSPWINYGVRTCSSVKTLMSAIYGTSSAPVNTVFDGYLSNGDIRWSPMTTWLKSWTALYYNGGNVGIGTITPAHKLDVNGNIRSFAENSWASSTAQISSNNSAHHGAFLGLRARGTIASPSYPKKGDALASLNGRDSIDGLASISNYGWAFIQMSAAQDFTPGAKGTNIYLWTTNIWAPLPTTKMTLEANGNVGIGTASPSVKLDVQGGDITIGKLGDTRKICLNGVCTDKIPDAQKGDILYSVRIDITSNQIPASYGATANDRVNNLFVAAWKSGVKDVWASLWWSAATIAAWQSTYTSIAQMRASIATGGTEWWTTLITGYLVPWLKNLWFGDYVKNLAWGCVGAPIVMMCSEGYACAYETFQPNIPAFGLISCIAR